jgi:UDP-4-amino-4,6-dideoxy-L-N-acetyl-beta-L-altrosamine transaminase
LIDFSKLKISKKKLFEILKKKGYSLQVNYIPTYKFTFFKKNFNKDDFPNTEDFYYKEISLPCYYDLPLKEVYKFSTILKKILLNYEK